MPITQVRLTALLSVAQHFRSSAKMIRQSLAQTIAELDALDPDPHRTMARAGRLVEADLCFQEELTTLLIREEHANKATEKANAKKRAQRKRQQLTRELEARSRLPRL